MAIFTMKLLKLMFLKGKKVNILCKFDTRDLISNSTENYQVPQENNNYKPKHHPLIVSGNR